MERLTIFTPAYNRAYCLPRAYEALKKQSNKDFIWLIVDDGSTDNTRQLVESWQKEDCGFPIEYVYKKNGGMHSAHNTAYDHIRTELNTCIDSDDILAEEAVEKILSFWEQHGSNQYAGIIGLDADFDGNIIGKGFDESLKSTTLTGYYAAGGFGDKKLVYRTEIINRYPRYPEFEGEKLVPLDYIYGLCDKDYELLVLPEVLCNVEYLADGSSKNILRQYYKNPKGFAFIRKHHMTMRNDPKYLFKENIHYVSSSIFSRNKNFLKESPKKLYTVLAIPFGILLSVYIKMKIKE